MTISLALNYSFFKYYSFLIFSISGLLNLPQQAWSQTHTHTNTLNTIEEDRSASVQTTNQYMPGQRMWGQKVQASGFSKMHTVWSEEPVPLSHSFIGPNPTI